MEEMCILEHLMDVEIFLKQSAKETEKTLPSFHSYLSVKG